MIVVAENINVMSKKLGPAMRNREAKPIQELAEKLTEAGADYLDLNIGPARKKGEEMMEWVVKTVNEVSPLPCFLDTMNISAMEAGLKAHKDVGKKPVMNSIMARPDRMTEQLPIAQKHNAAFVALMWGAEGIPRDENERGMLAADLVMQAMELGIAGEDIWVDPIVIPMSSQQNELQGCTKFLRDLPEMGFGCQSTCGLSNVSNGCPEKLRPLVNQTYLCILLKYGLTSAIVDPFDKGLMDIARGKSADIEALVGKVVDGEEIDMASLSNEERDYVKTAHVLLSHNLYSDSWLDL